MSDKLTMGTLKSRRQHFVEEHMRSQALATQKEFASVLDYDLRQLLNIVMLSAASIESSCAVQKNPDMNMIASDAANIQTKVHEIVGMLETLQKVAVSYCVNDSTKVTPVGSIERIVAMFKYRMAKDQVVLDFRNNLPETQYLMISPPQLFDMVSTLMSVAYERASRDSTGVSGQKRVTVGLHDAGTKIQIRIFATPRSPYQEVVNAVPKWADANDALYRKFGGVGIVYLMKVAADLGGQYYVANEEGLACGVLELRKQVIQID